MTECMRECWRDEALLWLMSAGPSCVMELRLSTALLRPWRDGDQESLVRYANNRNVSRNLRDAFPYPYTRRDAEWWVGQMANRPPPIHNLAIEVGGEAAGGIGFQLQDDVHRRTLVIG